MRRRFSSVLVMTIAALVLGTMPATALTTTPDASPWMANGHIKASVQYGNVMFVGGSFQRIGQSVSPGPSTSPFVDGYTGLAAIDMATGEAIANFKPQLEANANQTLEVFALAIVGNRLFVGGQFSKVDGQDHYNLAAIDINPSTIRGTVVSSFDPVVGIPGASNEGNMSVRTILPAIPASDGIYIGGAFSKVDGKGRPKTAKLDLNGNLLGSFKTPGVSGIVHDMVWAADGQSIFLGGGFKQLGTGNTRYAMGRVDPSGATLPWAVPPSQIPGATSSGQICYELAATATRLYAACGKGPNFVGAFRVDTGDVGNRTWQYGTGGNVQTLALISGSQDLVIGGHFGINSSSRYNGRMRCGPSSGPATWIRAVAIIRNVANTTNFVSPRTDGGTSPTEPWVDCGWLPNIDGQNQPWPTLTQNMPGTNPYGGLWEIQVTNDHLWALGEFRYVNTQVRRAIARFPWTGDPTPPPDPVQPVLAELVTASPLIVQPDRSTSFTIECPDQPDPCNGTAKLVGGGSTQLTPQAFSLAPLGQQTFNVTVNDEAWGKLGAKANGTIGGSVQLTAEGSPGTTPLSTSISIQLKLSTA